MTAYLDDAGRGRTAISHTFRDARQNQTDANKDRGRRKKMVAVMFCAYARYRPRGALCGGVQAAALYFDKSVQYSWVENLRKVMQGTVSKKKGTHVF